MEKIGLSLALVGCVVAPLLLRLGISYRVGLAVTAIAIIAAAALGIWMLRTHWFGLAGLVPLMVAAPFVIRGVQVPRVPMR